MLTCPSSTVVRQQRVQALESLDRPPLAVLASKYNHAVLAVSADQG
jgi:hypothetical protein